MLVLRRGIGEGSPVRLCRVPFVCRDDKTGKPAERRVARALALLDLIFVERLAIARNQRAHYGVLGLVRLQIAKATPLLAASAADHLMQ